MYIYIYVCIGMIYPLSNSCSDLWFISISSYPNMWDIIDMIKKMVSNDSDSETCRAPLLANLAQNWPSSHE